MASWSEIHGDQSFGELALLAGKLSCEGLADFLTRLTPSQPLFQAAGPHRRRAILTRCAQAIDAHGGFDFPDLSSDPRLLAEIDRLRADFLQGRPTPDGELEWLPTNGVMLIDRLAIKRSTRLFEAFTLFREDFEESFRRTPMTSYNLLQHVLRESRPKEVAAALTIAPAMANWLLPYLFSQPIRPVLGGGGMPHWRPLLATSWYARDQVAVTYNPAVWADALREDNEPEEGMEPLEGRRSDGAKPVLTELLTGERLAFFEGLLGLQDRQVLADDGAGDDREATPPSNVVSFNAFRGDA